MKANTMLAAALVVVCASFCPLGTASPVTWEFTGEIDQGNETGFFFPFAVAPGDAITIDMTLEPDTPCSLCGSTTHEYSNLLTALSFTANGTIFDFPLTSSDLFLAKDEPSPSPGHGFLNLFDLSFAGFDSSAGIGYQGNLALQSDTAMPPVPGINDLQLANLAPPNPVDFVSSFPDADTNFFDVVAGQDSGRNSFGGRTVTSAAVSVPEPTSLSLWAAGFLIMLLMRFPRTRSRGRLRRECVSAGPS